MGVISGGIEMLRRAALAASLLALFAVNTASAANGSVTITNDHYSVSSVTVGLGEQVTWTYEATHHHTATSNLLSGWGAMAWSDDFPANSTPGTNFSQSFHEAGGWQFHCLIHAPMRGTVNVTFTSNSATGHKGDTFTLTLGDQVLPTGFVHDIQKKRNAGAFKSWKTTTGMTQTFVPAKKGTYQFKTLVRNTTNGQASGYSPAITITVS